MAYATVDFANTFFQSINVEDWDDFDEDEQEAALEIATQALDSLYGGCYRGEMFDVEQDNLFPRTEFTDANGRPIPEDTIPTSLQQANSWLALDHLQGEDIYQGDLSGRNVTAESFSVGGLSESFSYGDGARPAEEVTKAERTIKPLLDDACTTGSTGFRQGTATNG